MRIKKSNIELDVNKLLYTEFKFSKGKLLHDVERMPDTTREFVYRICMNNQTYFLKSFETPKEIMMLPVITKLGFSDIIEIKIPLFIEKGYTGLTLDKLIQNPNIDSGLIFAETYNKLHGNKIILGDVKEEHFFYNPKTNEIKIIDFGASEISDDSYRRDDDIYQLLLIIDKYSNNNGLKIWKSFQEKYMFKDVLEKFPERRISKELKAYLNH